MTDINRPRTVALVDVGCAFKKHWVVTSDEPLAAARATLKEFERVRASGAHVILCCDAPPYKERLRIDPEYKAHRKPAEEGERQQRKWLMERAKKLGYQVARVEGWEADDVIATLARIYSEWCEEVRLVGADKDLAQCVTDNVVQFVPAVGDRKAESRNRLEVKAKFGVYPEQIALFLALQGDKSDNVPGVPSIGPKKAASLAAQYRTLQGIAEAMAANAAAPPPGEKSMWAAIANNYSALKRSLDLVTLNANLPLDAESLLLRIAPEEDDGSTPSMDVDLDGFMGNATPAPEDLEHERTMMSAPTPPPTSAPIIGKDPNADEVLRRAAAERAAIAQRPDLAAAAAAAEPESSARREVADARAQAAPAANDPQGAPAPRPRVTDAQFEEAPREVHPAAPGGKRSKDATQQFETSLAKVQTVNYGIVTEDLQPTDLRSARLVSEWLHLGGQYQKFNNAAAIFSVIARGREMGIKAATALACFHNIEGVPVASADLIRSLAERSPKCKYLRPVTLTSTIAVWETWHRDDEEPFRMDYTIEEAELAGLVHKDSKGRPNMWMKRPKQMLAKTCGVILARLKYPGDTLGLYCPEEMETDEEIAA